MHLFKILRITTVPVSLKTLLRGQHRFMSENNFEVIGVSSSGKALRDVSEHEGVKTVAVEMTRTISPIKDLKALWQFYRLCKKEKPIMVHSHTPKAGIVGMLGAKLAGVPIRLHTVAGMPLMEATGVKRKLLDFVEKLTYSSATKVYPNSQGLYNFIVEHNYTNSKKLKVIGQGSSNGIDTNHFAPEQVSAEKQAQLKHDLGIQPNDFVYVFVGRLVGDKGINELVEAFQKLEIRNQESGIKNQEIGITSVSSFEPLVSSPKSLISKLLLVGSFEAELDPLKNKTLQEIESNPNIISVGYQQDVRPYFAISDCLVFPSYREGFPNVVMQAGAMGLPSIVSNINGCNEIVVEGKNGTIIPVKNTEALKVAMQKIVDDKEYCKQLQQHARPMIRSRYEQKVVWNALLDEYNLLIKKLETRN
ncbi:MAG: glycosyltransferase family 4 protein [Mesonia hippocampi]|uniref:glycosyltransferase family 4 protein n=1 Tax=Mesonia hippocampi TaxID=1628250 RepID=UPI003F9E433B